ncbi:OsmC family protein [Deinococcus budaensis]|uniref:Organic hydroperoxide reductase OsmC/OhrA n=1 Tax=Deinococcus budaensis TaxID=1665626 RepID=A0A7W8GE24_9DEIO|nr:OsmC family protein [Deinococcus budaensis]MBB5233551.1 organic hydroperoxide reductase OsmC/OhrA [Deinococcus budaensis]
MRISAHVRNSADRHEVTLRTDGRVQGLTVPPRTTGPGSGVNGGELLFLALATCYCNDVYREAARRGLQVERVEVDVEGEFGGEGEPARNVTYRVRAAAQGSEAELRELLHHTDRVAEIQNTLRAGVPVTLAEVKVEGA